MSDWELNPATKPEEIHCIVKFKNLTEARRKQLVDLGFKLNYMGSDLNAIATMRLPTSKIEEFAKLPFVASIGWSKKLRPH